VILDVPEGVSLCREGVAEHEVFLSLSGEFGVFRGGALVARMGPGHLFGEFALLSKIGRRYADVRALSAGRVLVLRRKFLRRLEESKPRAAVALYEALTQELLRKLMEPPVSAAEGSQPRKP
jgi:CRP-like cAMP-binding protein